MSNRRSLRILIGGGLTLGLAAIFACGMAVAGNKDRLEIVLQARVTLPQAIEIALKEYPGYAIECALEERDGIYYYEVGLVSEDGEADVFIHPATGRIIGAKSKTGIAVRWLHLWQARLDVVRQAHVSALEVADIAAQATSGHIVDIDLKKGHSAFYYHVVLVTEGSVHEIDVALDSGEILRHESEAS